MNKKHFGLFVAGLLLCGSLVIKASAGEGDNRLSWGADIRVRLTHWDRNTVWQDGVPAGLEGPAQEYMRVRERLWLGYDFTEDVKLKLRIAQRWHYFSQSWADPNNDADNHASWQWSFPDEVIFDQFQLTINNINDTLDLSLGRQAVILGNGMIVLEGTPYDQGRSIYFDGAVATLHDADGRDKLKLLALYNRYRDDFLVLSDEERRLRRGDTLLTGAYWTHKFNEEGSLNSDLYVLYTDIDDERSALAEARNHPADENAQLWVYGARVFGKTEANLNYSLEGAIERGTVMGDTADMDATGMMVDARLNYTFSDAKFTPKLMLEYTYLSGDDPNSADEFEGWHPVAAEYPIWREELMPILLNGNWTNLHQYRTAVSMKLSKRVNLTAAWHYMVAEENVLVTPGVDPVPAGGRGDNIGHLFSAFLDVNVLRNWKAVKSWDCKFEASMFEPGDFFTDGQTTDWLRIENVITF